VKYTVVWAPEAADEAARLWMNADARGLIAAAIDAIDDMLNCDPYHAGESREGKRRILLVWPLAVYYSINDGDRIVKVSHVWRYDL
jgi:hypothetical protein